VSFGRAVDAAAEGVEAWPAAAAVVAVADFMAEVEAVVASTAVAAELDPWAAAVPATRRRSAGPAVAVVLAAAGAAV
jgi:hypothetical protein